MSPPGGLPATSRESAHVEDRVLTGRDGRQIAVRLVGPEGGVPVAWLHGFGGSRLEQHPDPSAAVELGVRVVAIDRPGTGGTSRLPGFTLSQVADDVAQVMDQLGHPRFAVAGLSWGGASALATAALHPGRVTQLTLVSSVGGWLRGPGAMPDPGPNWVQVRRACASKALVRVAMAVTAWQFRRRPEAALDRLAADAPRLDAAVLADPRLRAALRDKTTEALRQGVDGLVDDTLAGALPWNIDLDAVSVPTTIWWGEADTEVGRVHLERLLTLLPHAQPRLVPAAGHLLHLARWPDILQSATIRTPSPHDRGRNASRGRAGQPASDRPTAEHQR